MSYYSSFGVEHAGTVVNRRRNVCQRHLRHCGLRERITSRFAVASALHLPFLIHLDAADHPVGILECLGVMLHVLLARRRFGFARRLVPHARVPGPVAAEGGVEDDVEAREVLVDVAASGELGRRHAPFRRVGLARRDVAGNG